MGVKGGGFGIVLPGIIAPGPIDATPTTIGPESLRPPGLTPRLAGLTPWLPGLTPLLTLVADKVIYYGVLTTKPSKDREFQFVYICSLLSNKQLVRKENCSIPHF